MWLKCSAVVVQDAYNPTKRGIVSNERTEKNKCQQYQFPIAITKSQIKFNDGIYMMEM